MTANSEKTDPKLGGMFGVSSTGKPVFIPEDENGKYSENNQIEILTNSSNGLKIRVDSNPSVLYPNEYLQIGTVSQPVSILRLQNGKDDSRANVYEGEFKIVQSGSVTFPSTVRWHYLTEPNLQNYTYQFRIVQGFGILVGFPEK